MKQILQYLVTFLLGGGTLWAAVKYFVDRRDSKPQRQVAAQTVGAQVEAAALGNLERRLNVMEQAHDQEIQALQATITNLRTRVTELERRATQATIAVRYIRILRQWIDQQITDATVHPPPVPAGLELDD